MNEDIMKAIEQAARMATQDQKRMEKEAFINKVAMDTAEGFGTHLWGAATILTSSTCPSVEAWIFHERRRLSLQIEQVVRIILRTELLGE